MLRASAKRGRGKGECGMMGCWISFVQCTYGIVRGGRQTCLVTYRPRSVKSQKALTVALVGQIGKYAAGECLIENLPAAFSRRILGSNEGRFQWLLTHSLLDLFKITKAIGLSERSVARN